MKENFIKTGRFTNDGQIFHNACTNVRIGNKHYGNATEETLKNLGLFENIKYYVTNEEYDSALEELYNLNEEENDFKYKGGWQDIDGIKYWVSYEVIPVELLIDE